MQRVCFVIACSLLFLSGVSRAAPPDTRFTVHIAEHDIEVRHYPARGNILAIWIASGFGLQPRHAWLAEQLTGQNIESWQVDFLESLFLPRGTNPIRNLDPQLVSQLIQQAHQRTGKMIILLGNSYAAIPILRGMRQWQIDTTQPYLLGAILFSPNAYSAIPALGLEPEYIAETRATNLPVMIFQSERHGNRWQLDKLIEALQTGGSSVFFEIMPGVTSLFYEEDKAAATLQRLATMPQRLPQAIRLLAKLPNPTQAAPLRGEVSSTDKSLLDNQLKPFVANWSPPPLQLRDANDTPHHLTDYQGKVRIINFWASWCPPCVKEIPSLNNLRQHYQGEPFELISVNYAQTAGEVRRFLEQVQVDFPVLLDMSGEQTARWKVIAFPSTFIIDKQGRIRYGVNAAIEWDSPAVLNAIDDLLAE